MQEWVIAAYEPPLINVERLTLPQFLRDNGYETACLGKWHLGWDWVGPQKPHMHPIQRNFQKKLTWDFTRPIGGGPTVGISRSGQEPTPLPAQPITHSKLVSLPG